MDNLSVLSAYNEKLIKEVDYMSFDEIDNIIENSFSLTDSGDLLSLDKRIDILERLSVLMEKSFQDLVHLATLEGGKPLVDSKVEVTRAIQGVKIAIHALFNPFVKNIPLGLTTASENRISFNLLEPLGVVLGISAFNHPLNLIVHQTVPAIAAGCPVLIKPSLKTPLTCYKFVELLYQSGLPQNLCPVILCKDTITEQLVSDSRIRHVNFIGSADVGWKIRSQLAAGTSCTLEHGGVAPVILTENADIKKAVPLLAKGGFYHAGQVCVSVQKVFIHESKVDLFTKQMTKECVDLVVGDPIKSATDVGPLISYMETERVTKWVEEAVSGGGKVICGGNRLSRTCYQPTVILNPPEDCLLSKEEVFGPVISVYTYSDRDEAIKRANSLPYAFQAAVFSQDIDEAVETVKKLKATTVMINDHTAFRVDWMPFGGYRRSGKGVGGIPHSIDELTVKKLIVVKTP